MKDMFSRRALIRRSSAGILYFLGMAGERAMATSQGTPVVNLDQQLRELVEDPHAPLASLSVLVQHRDEVVYEAQFGRRYISSKGPAEDLPVTSQTLFRIASITKLTVSMCAMRLVEAGMLDLDADIGHLLGYRVRHPAHPAVPITPRLLMSHRSGLSDAGNDLLDGRTDLRALLFESRDALGARNAWGKGRPGVYFEYSNLNFIVLAAALECASGLRFDRLMQSWILDPLDMAGGFDTSRLDPAVQAQVATLYRKAVNDESTWDPAGPWYAQTDDVRAAPPQPLDAQLPEPYVPGSHPALFGPQGRLRTRVHDLAKLATLFQSRGRYKGRQILRPESVQAMMTETWRSNLLDGPDANGDDDHGTFQAWGLGMQHFIDRSKPGWGDRLQAAGGIQAWGHLGFAYGLVSGLLVDPSSGCSIVYIIGGTGADPAQHPGAYSSFPIWEERLQGLLWHRAASRS